MARVIAPRSRGACTGALRDAGGGGDEGAVGGKAGDEEGHEAPGGGATGLAGAGLGDEDPETAGDLRGTAEEDELAVSRQIVGHDAYVGGGRSEVEAAGDDIESTHGGSRESQGEPPGRTKGGSMSRPECWVKLLGQGVAV